MPVGILKVSGVPTPECLGGRFGDSGSSLFCLFHNAINFSFTADVVTDCKFGWIRHRSSDIRIPLNTAARPKSKLQSPLQIEECDSAIFKFLANDSFGFKTETIAIEGYSLLQVINTQRKQRNPRFHVRFSPKHKLQRLAVFAGPSVTRADILETYLSSKSILGKDVHMRFWTVLLSMLLTTTFAGAQIRAGRMPSRQLETFRGVRQGFNSFPGTRPFRSFGTFPRQGVVFASQYPYYPYYPYDPYYSSPYYPQPGYSTPDQSAIDAQFNSMNGQIQ